MDDQISHLFFFIAIALAFIFLIIAFKSVAPPKPPPLQAAQVQTTQTDPTILKELIDAGATFYGASWCGFTKKQLAELNISETDSKGLDYVDCEKQEEFCREKNIEAFPTWQINGEMYPGYYSAQKLREMLKK